MGGFMKGLKGYPPGKDRGQIGSAIIDYSLIGENLQGYKVGFAANVINTIQRIKPDSRSSRTGVPIVNDWQVPVTDQEFYAFQRGGAGMPLEALKRYGKMLEENRPRAEKVWRRTSQAHTLMKDYWAYLLGLKVFLLRNGVRLDPSIISYPDRLYGSRAALDKKTAGEAIYRYIYQQSDGGLREFISSQYSYIREMGVSEMMQKIDIDFPFSRQVRQVLAGYKFTENDLELHKSQ